MSASLDRPNAVYQPPGPDQQGRSLQEIADEFLAVLGADNVIDPTEGQVVQYLLAGIHSIGSQRVGPAPPPQPISNDAAPIGQNAPGAQPMPTPDGTQYASLT